MLKDFWPDCIHTVGLWEGSCPELGNKNEITLNLLKNVESVFDRPNDSHDLLSPIMPSVSRVVVAKLVGVYLRHNQNSSQQAEFVVANCNQGLFVSTAQLKKQGLGIYPLDSLLKAILLNKILYALLVYFGYLTEGERNMLQKVLHKANSRCFTPNYYDLDK